MMRPFIEFLVRVVLMALIVSIMWWTPELSLSPIMNLAVVVVGVLLTYPLVLLGRKSLDRNQTQSHVAWVTTIVHFGLGFTLAVPVVRAITRLPNLPGWELPVPREIGLAMVIITGAASAVVVMNLAVRGLGAPFFIALSRRLAVDWLYAWTRNPMVLAGLAFFLSLGIWFQSAMFVLWIILLFAPALLFFIKVYEERELELRFGAAYLEYKSKTPMLWPRRPKA
jgi:protein-S-isoprenylcysteine O-methyltransferase Ste14